MAKTHVRLMVVCVLVHLVQSYDTMKGPPRAEKNEVKHIAKEGDDVKIVCPVQAHPAPLVTWHKGEEAVDYTWTRFRVNKRQLRIRGVLRGDTGRYTCKAINGFGKVEISVELVVINPEELTGVSAEEISKLSSPVFSRRTQEEDKSLVRSVGSDLTLRCSATGFPQPSVSWYKDDTLLRGTSGDKIHFRSLSSRDSGAYSCVAQNIIGTSSQTFTLNVRSSGAEERMVRPGAAPSPGMIGQANISVEQGDTATLDCRVDTDYAPNIKWLRKVEKEGIRGGMGTGDLINVGSDFYRLIESSSAVSRTAQGEYLSELILRHAGPEDEGMYICFVTSLNGGFNFKPSYLTVVEKSDITSGAADRGLDTTLLILVISVSVVTTLLILAAVACLVQRRQKPGSHTQSSQDTVSVDVTPEKPIFRRQGSGSYDKPSFPITSSRLEDLLTQSTPLNSPDNTQDQPHYFITRNYNEFNEHFNDFNDPYNAAAHNIYEVPATQGRPGTHPPLPHYPPYAYYESARLNNSFNSSYSSRR